LATDAILVLENVIAGYGRTTILNETSIAVRRGAITTIVGPNGAGKSTVFKTVFGLLPVRSGHIRFEGRDITNSAPRALLDAGLCYVPQGRNIFPELSVFHNLELGGVAARSDLDIRAGIEAGLDRFPALRRKAAAQASTLSGGEQKLLEIARGLLLKPKLMLIDEPSIGLSPIMAKEVLNILRALRDSGVTVLLVEQNVRSALAISDFAIVMEQGRARVQDTARAILDNPQIGHLFLGGTTEGQTGTPEAQPI
jgi:branched-chain amino acid transport system ATP-binding protein